MISSSDLVPGGLTGRAAQTTAIRHAVARSRLVTVTGLPGVGKSATAVTAALALTGSFADGVALIRLDALADEALLPHTIAAALLLPDTFGASPLTALTEQLASSRLLLVLDTCEHLLGACAATASALTEQCPGVRVLATSREPLRVPGEDTLDIAPLPAPDAVALFSERATQYSAAQYDAGQHKSDQHNSDQDQATVRPLRLEQAQAVCARLDGLPLALAMAARQLATGSLDELATSLDSGYEFLSDPDTPLARHRTMTAAIGWSHQLCTPAERLLWARLAVFDQAFSVQDCLQVCTSSQLSEDTVKVGVPMLAERSLLLGQAGRQGGGPPRYLLPRVIRAYGLGMLCRLAEEEQMQRRYRRWRDGQRRDQS